MSVAFVFEGERGAGSLLRRHSVSPGWLPERVEMGVGFHDRENTWRSPDRSAPGLIGRGPRHGRIALPAWMNPRVSVSESRRGQGLKAVPKGPPVVRNTTFVLVRG
jgi:hypothetical protein